MNENWTSSHCDLPSPVISCLNEDLFGCVYVILHSMIGDVLFKYILPHALLVYFSAAIVVKLRKARVAPFYRTNSQDHNQRAQGESLGVLDHREQAGQISSLGVLEGSIDVAKSRAVGTYHADGHRGNNAGFEDKEIHMDGEERETYIFRHSCIGCSRDKLDPDAAGSIG